MKKVLIGLIGVALTFGMAGLAEAVPVNFTVTADNIVAAWYQDGGSPTSIGLGGYSNLADWKKATTVSVDLEYCHTYEIIFQTLNDDKLYGYRLPSAINPSGFLGEISPAGLFEDSDYPLSLLTNEHWDVSTIHMSDPYVSPSDAEWNTITSNWTGATEWALNSGKYVSGNPLDSSGSGYEASDNNIWYNAVGSISGISGDAKWIWTYDNFDMDGAPGNDNAGSGAPGDAIFFRVTVHPVPEPATMLLFGSGLLGLLAGLGRARRRRRS